jgi:hypothetical protein
MADEGEDTEPYSDDSPDSISDTTDKTPYSLALDEHNYCVVFKTERPQEDVCFESAEWINNYRATVVSYLRRYIFADKYNIHQLRDDIMAAVIAQVRAWNWWPDPDKELIQFAYANLPKSSKFLRFLVLSAVYLWLPLPD